MVALVDRHVLRQIATPLAAAMAIGLMMLLAERMVRLLDNTLGKKNSFAVVFELLAYLVPHYLGTAIPAALFLGLLLGFGKMTANSETDAFMASGIGLNRLARPVIVLALVLSAASFAIFGWLQPYTRYAYRSQVFDISNVDVFYLAQEGVFMQAGERTFILDKLDRQNNAFERAFIYEDKGVRGSDTVTATRGTLVEVPAGDRPALDLQPPEPRPVLKLQQGHRITLHEKPSFANAPPPEVTEFALADTPLGRINKDIFRPRGEDERELTLPELWSAFDNPPKEATADDVRTEFHRRLVNVVSLVILPFLAIPFAIGSRRSARASRLGVALVLLVIYHEVIEQGSVVASRGNVSPVLALWVPCLLLAVFAFWRYYVACFTIRRDGFDAALDAIGDSLSTARAFVLRRFGGSTA